QSVSNQWLEIDDVVVGQRVRLTLERLALVELAHADVEVAAHGSETAAAHCIPVGVDGAPDDEALGYTLEREIDPDPPVGRHLGTGAADVGQRSGDPDHSGRARSSQQVCDGDAERGGGRHGNRFGQSLGYCEKYPTNRVGDPAFTAGGEYRPAPRGQPDR